MPFPSAPQSPRYTPMPDSPLSDTSDSDDSDSPATADGDDGDSDVQSAENPLPPAEDDESDAATEAAEVDDSAETDTETATDNDSGGESAVTPDFETMAFEHIDGYDEMTVPEVEDYLDNHSLSVSELEDLRNYEKQHKYRTGVLDAVNDEIDEKAPDVEDGPEFVELRPKTGTHYVAGVWFDDPMTFRRVPYNSRIERAVENGDAELLDDYAT